jgi:C1A family cysteine protease
MHSSRFLLAAALFLAACSAPTPSSLSSGDDSDDSVSPPKSLTKKPKPKDGDEVTTPHAVGGGASRVYYASHAEPKSRHVYGLLTDPAKRSATRAAIHPQTTGGELPPVADLTDTAPAPGDQQQTGSCATWATGYSLMGWWANRIGLQGAPYAPMFLYAPQVQGACDQGTFIEDNLEILRQFGIPSATSYQPMQAQLDCATQATQPAVDDAAAHRIISWQSLDLSSSKSVAIAEWVAAGFPVVIGMQTFNALENATEQSFLIDQPPPGEASFGGHAVTVFAYDQSGVWFLNSWGDTWGFHGWAQLSWDFLEGAQNGVDNINSAAVVTDVVGWQH